MSCLTVSSSCGFFWFFSRIDCSFTRVSRRLLGIGRGLERLASRDCSICCSVGDNTGAFSVWVTVGWGFCSDATSFFTAEYSSSESTRIASSPLENTRYSVILLKKAHVSHLHHS